MYLVPSLIVFNHGCVFKNQNRKLKSYTIFPFTVKSIANIVMENGTAIIDCQIHNTHHTSVSF